MFEQTVGITALREQYGYLLDGNKPGGATVWINCKWNNYKAIPGTGILIMRDGVPTREKGRDWWKDKEKRAKNIKR